MDCRRKKRVMNHLFCFGLGYSADVVAQRLLSKGWRVSGTARSPARADGLSARGYCGFVYDGAHAVPDVTNSLSTASHILLSIPPNADGDPAFAHFSATLANSFALSWIGYFSTVGVYGDAGGGWVDESTAAEPLSERGRRRLAAERHWLSLGERAGKSVVIFRLPGIYGPGRSALDDIRAGTARRIIKPGQVFNRIHVEDIANAVEAAIARPHVTGPVNVTDDEPGPPQDAVAYAAELLRLPPPPEVDFATAPLSEMARSFYSESKRVRNTRLKNELGVRLDFPNYRDGLKGILAAGA
jgi:nucleoside-diphosphate-sugar epimerase